MTYSDKNKPPSKVALLYFSQRILSMQLYRLAALLLDDAVTVGVEEVFKLGDLAAELCTLVGVGDEHAVGGHLDDLGGGLDVGASENGVLRAGEGLMLHELEASAVVDKGVASDACLLVVGLRETAVDDHETTAGLDGILAGSGMNRHVAVDDVTRGGLTIDY